MKGIGPFLSCFALLALAAAGARSDGGVRKAQRRDEKFAFQLTAGPGYVQHSFVEDMNRALDASLGEDERKRLRARKRLKASQMVELMNTRNKRVLDDLLRDGFGIRGGDRRKGREAVEAAKARKDRRIFFGVLARVLLKRGFSSSGEFFGRVMAARDEIDDEQFKHLRHGSNRTEALMEACFKLENRKDQKDMLAILEEVRQSFLFGHPLAESIGIRARYQPRRFPELKDGMPGTGDEYEDGLAGGHAFDDELPALPYGGPNVDELLNPKRLPR